MHRIEASATWRIFWGCFALALVIFFIYRSTSMYKRLKPAPPSQFVVLDARWDPERREKEMRLAQAYWAAAIAFIEPRYAYGVGLPDAPPHDFRVDTRQFPGAEASRHRYWQQLRKVWLLPESWENAWRWDTNWLFGG